MWQIDLIFNGLLLAADVFAFRRFQNHWKRSRWLSLGLVALIYGCFALLLTLAVTYSFTLRPFAIMRFLGMALFWHLPLLLFGLAVPMKSALPALVGVFLLAVYTYAYHIEPHRLEITRYEFKHAMLRGLKRSIVIAQVSDIQTDQVGEFEQRVFELLAGLQPDIIVHTGDYLHCRTESDYAVQAVLLRSMLLKANLHPPFGIFAVMGDADEPHLWKNVFQSQPVKILEDETVLMNLPGVSINVTGLNPHTSRVSKFEQLGKPMIGSQDGLLQIFIGHSPDYVRALQQTDRAFLALAGHTHGGQVQLPFVGPILTLTRLSSRYGDYYGTYGTGVLSVSRGIGMERRDAPRLRFLCRPEIRLVTLSTP